ncbi:MAG: hypothetical protein SXV54_12225 [Chloroflexota bacterium]|nr:hypothetical protein [Chloroflexota bacterium]
MAKMRTSIGLSSAIALIVVIGLLTACGSPTSTQPTEPSKEVPGAAPTTDDGATLLQERCTTCHGLDQVTQSQQTREEWDRTVVRMVDKGAQLNKDEQNTLVEYLTETYGP